MEGERERERGSTIQEANCEGNFQESGKGPEINGPR